MKIYNKTDRIPGAMLKIRLKRTGKKHEAHYRIVVMESQKSRNSKSLAEIGYYNPRTQPSTFEFDKEAAKEWLSKGAQPSETVAHYFVKEKLIKAKRKGSTKPQGKGKKKEETSEEKA